MVVTPVRSTPTTEDDVVSNHSVEQRCCGHAGRPLRLPQLSDFQVVFLFFNTQDQGINHGVNLHGINHLSLKFSIEVTDFCVRLKI